MEGNKRNKKYGRITRLSSHSLFLSFCCLSFVFCFSLNWSIFVLDGAEESDCDPLVLPQRRIISTFDNIVHNWIIFNQIETTSTNALNMSNKTKEDFQRNICICYPFLSRHIKLQGENRSTPICEFFYVNRL